MARPGTELRRGVGGRAQIRAARYKRFTPARQDVFFAELAATCNVAAAARKVRIDPSTAYNHRRLSAEFRARWEEAVREAYANLELAMLERVMNGTAKTVTRADGSVDRTHEYPNAIALQLLRQHRDLAPEAQAPPDPEEIEEVRARVAAKIERLRERIRKEGAGAGSGIDTGTGSGGGGAGERAA